MGAVVTVVIGDRRFGPYDEPDYDALDDACAAGEVVRATNLLGEGIASEPRSERAKGSAIATDASSPGRNFKEAAGGLGPAAA
jgi:hypothetical protein